MKVQPYAMTQPASRSGRNLVDLGMPSVGPPSKGPAASSPEAEFDAFAAAAREHDLKVIVESGIVGREIECAVLQGRGLDAPRTSMPGEIVVEEGHGHDFYDFEAKYLDEASVVLSCPADLPEAVADEEGIDVADG